MGTWAYFNPVNGMVTEHSHYPLAEFNTAQIIR
jgi:hypothetical protein